ncbi:MAG: GNAT family N-acetyltransferase [bacterium]
MGTITFTVSLKEVRPSDLSGFFVGWQTPPSPEKFLRLLTNSEYRVLALDGEKVVGFITAITDKTLAAYIPFLEVLPEYQGRGIGQKLVKQMLDLLSEYYMVDLLCDAELQPFYEKLGMKKTAGMMVRNYAKQSGLDI